VRGHTDADGGTYGNQAGWFVGGRYPQAVFAKDGLFDELKKALAERPARPPPLTHQRTQSMRIANMRRDRLNVADRHQAEWGRLGDFRRKVFLIGLGPGGLLELSFHWLEGRCEHGGGHPVRTHSRKSDQSSQRMTPAVNSTPARCDPETSRLSSSPAALRAKQSTDSSSNTP
jgi:hypothetical protein